MLTARWSNLNRSPTPRSVLPVSSRLGTPFGVQHGIRTQFTETHQVAGNSHQHHSKVRRQTEVDLFRMAAPGLSSWHIHALSKNKYLIYVNQTGAAAFNRSCLIPV
jgi:hypothetical protein